MGRLQQFCVSSSYSMSKTTKTNPKKRKECQYQQARSEVFTGPLPLFNECASWVKKPKTSSAVSTAVDSSRAQGRVLDETSLFYDKWVNKMNSSGLDSRNNEVVLSGLLPLFEENPSWVRKPKTRSIHSSPVVASRIQGRVTKELKLFDGNWDAKKSSMPDSRSKESAEEMERRVLAFNLRKMRSSYSLKDLLEEESRGVSTQLSVYFNDPFKLKKKMKPSDLGNLCRLLVSADLVQKHILPFLNKDQIKQVEVEINHGNEEIKGLKVRVWDMNTESMHPLVFKRWSTSKSYIFNDGCTKQFVKRRNLVEGDEIGLYWDNNLSRFNFSVLSRSAPTS